MGSPKGVRRKYQGYYLTKYDCRSKTLMLLLARACERMQFVKYYKTSFSVYVLSRKLSVNDKETAILDL